MHQNELDSILGAAMEESMEILTVNPTYSIGKEVEGKELAADFIQNMLMRTTSKSTFEVEILTADAQKGLLDVRVTEYYRQIWGTGKAVARKTVILDDVEGKEEVFSKISFWKSYKDNKGEEKRIVKQVVVPGSTYPRLAVRLPCGSASINNTFFPSLARPIPKFTVVVVFPTPPFWFVMDITLHICCSSCILSSKFFITECFQIFINKIQIN